MSSVGSEGSESSNSSRAGEIVKTGYLKKLKTMKKKFFVLRADSPSTQACLEYYDTGKKWKNNHPPKRSIILKNCFNINRRTDTKHKYVIALFTGTDCFGIVLDCEDDMLDWLKLLLMYQQGEETADCASLRPYFEHVWRVTIQKKELACKHNVSGVHLLCLSEGTLTLARPTPEEEPDIKHYDFSLQSIRRCGNLDAFFYMELGQASCLGSGNLWMQAEDSNTAHHMHSVIMNACTNCPKKELAPKSRSRSSSANEASKPISFGRKWPSSGDDSLSVISHPKSQCHQEHATTVGHSVSSVGDHHHHHNLTSVPYSPYPPIRRASTGTRPVTAGPAFLSSARTNSSYTGRERCDSLPTRPRMQLDSLSHARSGNTVSHLTPVSGRPHSMYTRGVFSPSGCSHPTSPMSATYSTDSAGSSLSVDGDSENWSEMENISKIILEENCEDYVQWGGNQNKNFLAENIPHNNNNTCRNLKIYHHSSSNSQSSCSPCSSSPMDAAGYMPMSPESIAENRNRQQLNRSYDSVNHSRESSIHEDLGEGYVPMAPLSVDTGYMSMDQSSRKPGDLSPGLSSCSITSGTPSTDARFSEFHLDKVTSYLTPSDDDIIFNVRQTRAYSTGSKPDNGHNKFVRCDSTDGLRVRAFSVGSRCGTNMPPTPRRTPASTSTSSIEPCDDHMEIDYSANKLRNRHIRTRMRHQNSPVSGGVVHTSNEKLTVPHSTASLMLNDGYMDMSPKSSPKLESFYDSRSYSLDSPANKSPPRLSKHLIGRSVPINVGFVNKQAYTKGSPSTTSCLEKVIETESQGSNSSSKLRLSDEESSYMDMKPGVYDVPDGVPKVTAVIATASDLHVRKENFTVLDPSSSRTPNTCNTLPHIKQPLIDTEGKQFKSMGGDKTNGTPDGYVDMTFKGRRVENQSAKLVARIPEKTPEGYVDMSFKGSRKNLTDSNSSTKVTENKTPTYGSGKENQLDPRQSSKPIAIQQSKGKRSVGSGFFRRKQSDEQTTSKPNFLPLGISIHSFPSLGRKNKKTCQKKDKTAESPASSNSGTIFPLSPDRTPSLDYDPNSKCAINASGESIRLTGDYEATSLEGVDETVNWNRRSSEDSDHAEYTVMTPGLPIQRKKSEPACLSYSLNRVNVKSDQARMKILHRSTSVPSAMSAMKSRCPSFSEFGRTDCCCEADRSENTTARIGQKMDVDVAETPREANLNLVDVPNAFASDNANAIRLREKVMYATLELPPASEQDENCIKEESESLSATKIPDQSNLTYAQIDFEKASSSSSN